MKYFFFMIFVLQDCAPAVFPKPDSSFYEVTAYSGKKKPFPKDSLYLGFEEDFDFDPKQLAEFKNVQSLEIRNSNFGSTGAKILPSWKTLEYLNLSDSGVTELSFTEKFPKLASIILHRTKVTEISSLSGRIPLTRLEAAESPLSSLSGIERFPFLRRLDIRKTKIADISGLSKNKKLYELRMGGTEIKNITVLYGMTELTYLETDSTSVTEESLKTLLSFNPYVKIVRRGR